MNKSAWLMLFCSMDNWFVYGVGRKRKALSKGQRIYLEHCQRCHGAHGNAQLNGAKIPVFHAQYGGTHPYYIQWKRSYASFCWKSEAEEITLAASYLDSLLRLLNL